MTNRTCTISGCGKPRHGRGWCDSHYGRWLRTGTPEAPTTEDRFWAKVDKNGPIPEIFPELGQCWLWTATTIREYGWFRMDGKGHLAHRASWQISVGPIPPGIQIDHRCHNQSCVRPDHLRLATHKQNMENLASARRISKSGIRGVSLDKRRSTWEVTVKHNGKRHYLGAFSSKDEAERTAIAKRNELFTHNDADRKATQ